MINGKWNTQLKRCKVKTTHTAKSPKIAYRIVAHSINDKIGLIIAESEKHKKIAG